MFYVISARDETVIFKGQTPIQEPKIVIYFIFVNHAECVFVVIFFSQIPSCLYILKSISIIFYWFINGVHLFLNLFPV